MHIIVAHNVIYHRASREADMTSASYSKKTTQHGVLARRHAMVRWEWVVCGVWHTILPYPYLRLVAGT